MRVFLAGGTGHVGGGILAELLRGGHEATVLARRPDRARSGQAPVDSRVRLIPGDVGDPGAWQRELAGHDACIQAAGLIRSRGRNTFRRVVVEGTRSLVAACRTHGVPRFVLISANGAEAARTEYQTTKLEAERLVRDSGLAYTIFRPSLVFGPTDDFTTRFARLLRWGLVPVFGRGEYRLAPVALPDLSTAVVRALATSGAVNRTFHVCGPQSYSFKEVLALIRKASRRRALLAPVPLWGGYAAAALLGWLPLFPVTTDMLRMLVQGNDCPEHEWTRLFRVQPRAFEESLAYLATRP